MIEILYPSLIIPLNILLNFLDLPEFKIIAFDIALRLCEEVLLRICESMMEDCA